MSLDLIKMDFSLEEIQAFTVMGLLSLPVIGWDHYRSVSVASIYSCGFGTKSWPTNKRQENSNIRIDYLSLSKI